MSLGLNQRRVFEGVTRGGSFGNAAEHLSVIPPAVSFPTRQRGAVARGPRPTARSAG